MPNLSDKLARVAIDHEIDLLRVAASANRKVQSFLMRSRGYTLEQVNEMITERRA